MYRWAKQLRYVLLAAVITGLLLGACTNDLKKIREISAKQVNSPADTTLGVDIIFSDSAIVKARMLTPLMLEYAVNKDTPQSYRLMPKGIKIILFDQYHQETGNIIADTAYYYEALRVVRFRKNVVATSVKGDVFRSDELNWNMAYHKITSGKPVDIRMANGNVAHGSALETNEKFNPLNLVNSTGLLYLDNKFGQ